ncbi:MAG: SLC45 family MFS transporter [Bacteroidaceae bacterium]|jgi:maltose/moltooligosaccharide transporter|nr:SLC45 family MFS transporter [Bacteroidaceae bacterium]
MKKIPDLGFWKLWNISFGFFGVQIAYALQSANISRIFSTLGADPHDLSYFWILPPLAGIIVQPIIGAMSDRTWTRFGRRIPYLFVGALIAVAVMCLLPNAGSFGMTVGAAMIFGLISLMFLDTSINMAMQPFKMMVGDMVNEKQKGLAYSIQSFLCNAGSLAGYVFPYLFSTIGISKIAPKGVIPDSVIYSFYVGAAILILCVIYTTAKVKEYPPQLYAEYHGINQEEKHKEKTNMFKLLVKAPKAFWTVGLVQFFCWAAFMFMWTYTNGTVAANVFGAPETINAAGAVVLDTASEQYQAAGDWVGILFAVQAIGSVIWATIIPQFKSLKMAYVVSLVLGGIGFISTLFIHDQHLLFVSFLLIGCAWAAMLALPFTILTNALTGGHMGTYLGLFNGTICIPQIVAASLGGLILKLFTTEGSVPPEVNMLVLAGILLFVGACCVGIIKEKK